MNSRVIDRVRLSAAKARSGTLFDGCQRPSFVHVATQSAFSPNSALRNYLARFRDELDVLAAKAYGPFEAKGVCDKVVELASERGTRRVLAWAETEIGCPGLADALRQASIEMVPGIVPNDSRHKKELERLAAFEVGLSGVTAALADTGSIVVASGPGRARIASLLPPIHIAVVPVDRLYPTMQDWLADGGAKVVTLAANVVVITGSSRTSDIELELTLGMHGPKELHVVLLDTAAPVTISS